MYSKKLRKSDGNSSVDTRLLTFDIYQLHLNENLLWLCLTWPSNNVISTQMIWRACDIPINSLRPSEAYMRQ